MGQAARIALRQDVDGLCELLWGPVVVSVQMTNQIPFRGSEASVKRSRFTLMILANVVDPRKRGDDLWRFIRRTVINHNDFVGWPGLRHHAFQAAPKKTIIVICTDNDRCSCAHAAE